MNQDALQEQNNTFIYAQPNFEREWEEALRYPEFKSMGREKWIRLAKNGSSTSYEQIAKSLTNVDLEYSKLDSQKRKRFELASAERRIEMPIAVKFADRDYDLVSGNTRVAGLVASGLSDFPIWVIDLSMLTERGEWFGLRAPDTEYVQKPPLDLHESGTPSLSRYGLTRFGVPGQGKDNPAGQTVGGGDAEEGGVIDPMDVNSEDKALSSILDRRREVAWVDFSSLEEIENVKDQGVVVLSIFDNPSDRKAYVDDLATEHPYDRACEVADGLYVVAQNTPSARNRAKALKQMIIKLWSENHTPEDHIKIGRLLGYPENLVKSFEWTPDQTQQYKDNHPRDEFLRRARQGQDIVSENKRVDQIRRLVEQTFKEVLNEQAK